VYFGGCVVSGWVVEATGATGDDAAIEGLFDDMVCVYYYCSNLRTCSY